MLLGDWFGFFLDRYALGDWILFGLCGLWYWSALAKLVNVEITDTLTVDGDFQLTVDDGSGPAVVLLDSDVPFTGVDAYVPGVSIDATGVLVPAAPGQWSLKPRSDADLVVR